MATRAKRQGRRWVRIVVDVAMGALFVAVMATALVQEAPHEYLGIGVFVAVVTHMVLNRRWSKALLRGRYGAVRILQLVAIVGLLVCVIGQIASSLVLSRHAFGSLPALPGASWARRVHMLCSYWSFVFAFAHAGLQLKGFERLARPSGADRKGGTSRATVWIARIAFGLVACYGVLSFVRLNLGSYLLGQVQFAFVSYAEPLVLSFSRYAAVAVLVAGVFHYLRRILETVGRR